MRPVSRVTRVLAPGEPIPTPRPEYELTPDHLQRVGFKPDVELWPFVHRSLVSIGRSSRPDNCWIYQSPQGRLGYLWVGSEQLAAGRVAWLLGSTGADIPWLTGSDEGRTPGRPIRYHAHIGHLCARRKAEEGVCVNPTHLFQEAPSLSLEELRILFDYGRADLVVPTRNTEGLPAHHPRRLWWEGYYEHQNAHDFSRAVDCEFCTRIDLDSYRQTERGRRLERFEETFWSRTDRWLVPPDPELDREAIARRVEALKGQGEEDTWAEAVARVSWEYEHPGQCWMWRGQVKNGYALIQLHPDIFLSVRRIAWSLAVTAEPGGAPPIKPRQRITTICGRALCVRNDGPKSHLRVPTMTSYAIEYAERFGFGLTGDPLADRMWTPSATVKKYIRELRQRG